jgi:hypothetical protein
VVGALFNEEESPPLRDEEAPLEEEAEGEPGADAVNGASDTDATIIMPPVSPPEEDQPH